MKWLQGVLAFFTSGRERARSSWDPITNPFDAKRVAGELRLEELGREFGSAGVPLESDTSLSGTESSAVLSVEQAQTDYIESYQLRLKALQAQVSRSNLSAAIAEAMSSADHFERQAANLLTENATELQRFEEVARSRREALDRFRALHHRVELPHYPGSAKRLFYFVAAIALVGLETALNSNFFAKGLGGGVLQGIVEAGAFSVTNIVLSLGAGVFVARYKNHVSWAKRLAGYVGTTAVVCGIAALALLVSHYRDALIGGAENAGALAMQTLTQNPIGLAEPSSWILATLTFAAGIFALWEGYVLDDRYPGYGRVHRMAEEAANEYGDYISALRAELATYRQSLLERLEAAQRACDASLVELKGAIADKQRLGDEMPNQIRSLQSALVALVMTFRQANNLGRQGRPSPDYFRTTPQLDSRVLPDFSTDADLALLAQQQVQVAEFLGTQADIRARIQSAFNDRYSSLLTVNELFNPARNQENADTKPHVIQAELPASVAAVPMRNAFAEGGAGA